MIEIEKPRVECVHVSDDNSYGKFVVVSLSEQTKKGRLRLLANKYI